MKIIRTDKELELPLVDRELVAKGHELVLLPEGISEDLLLEEVRDCDLLLMCYTPVSKKVIEASTKLKAIIKYGVGIDAIDITAANNKGVVVVNVPEYAEETVAEGAFAMLLALTKKIPSIHHQMSDSSWVWPTQRWLGKDVSGKTLGIIGCGKIGTSMARMAGMGFNAQVIGYDPYKSRDELAIKGITKVNSLNTLLEGSDFISLHAVLTNETHHILGKKELAKVKKTAFIINTARGALIDEEELLQALEKGQVAGAALDVFSREPLNQEFHPLKKLYTMENVLLFPHLSFYTEEAMLRLEMETLDRCQEVFENRPILIKTKDPRLQQQSHLNTVYKSDQLL
ncbi:MAG: C-terminal binding protein [Cytophagales bacterium]|uniref:C-terminal binding protein n=1 Tax=Cyclobacterium marinum TaxID=104 RepID=UPI0011EF0589|nr:C-terminal binding protein [Cyclobacterium marinum]MBI0401508.1 C-terminal binding protein [Cyclobacterium marinum]MBR9776272.1 C-terminal binding protein [Cytophagales bacterium]|tara:strand:+ start:12080 stop:13108 length:1029 start_codon:yes stop_codon:yes gene_type:complete